MSRDTLTMEQYEEQIRHERTEREVRFAMRDLDYRLALGVRADAALPKAIGSSGGQHRARGVRGTKRLSS